MPEKPDNLFVNGNKDTRKTCKAHPQIMMKLLDYGKHARKELFVNMSQMILIHVELFLLLLYLS